MKCVFCEKEITPKRLWQRFCSDLCRVKYYQKNKLVAKVFEKNCVICGLAFQTTRENKIICGYDCRCERSRRINLQRKRTNKVRFPDYGKLNETESKYKDVMIAEGWNVFHRGFPDFIMFKDNKVKFVEVKRKVFSSTDELTAEQKTMIELLKSVGLDAEVVYMD